MNDSRFETKLATFAEGKRLRRFRGVVRNPKDSTCDACGSALPNNLWGLRDMEARKDYFVTRHVKITRIAPSQSYQLG